MSVLRAKIFHLMARGVTGIAGNGTNHFNAAHQVEVYRKKITSVVCLYSAHWEQSCKEIFYRGTAYKSTKELQGCRILRRLSSWKIRRPFRNIGESESCSDPA